MGRPRLTDQERWLRGNLEADRDRTKSAQERGEAVIAAGRPKFPQNLTPEERRAFKMFCRLLEERRQLTEGDVYLLEVAATIYARWQEAKSKLTEQGIIVKYSKQNAKGDLIEIDAPNLYLKVAEVCEKNLTACLDRLGLTGLNKTRVKQTEKPTPTGPKPGTAAWLLQQYDEQKTAPPAPEPARETEQLPESFYDYN